MAKQFRFEKDKFAAMDLTSMASDMAKSARAAECPMHLEARVRKLGRRLFYGGIITPPGMARIVSQVQRILITRRSLREPEIQQSLWYSPDASQITL
jgi:hypothetical protein